MSACTPPSRKRAVPDRCALVATERRRLVVLRHGRTSWNEQRRFQGSADLPLDDTGHEQAALAAEQIGRMQPSILLTSDSVRARQTAEPLAEGTKLEMESDTRFSEADLGTWEGLTREEVRRRYPEEYAAWRHGIDLARGGGETYAQVAARAVAALTEALPRLRPGELLVLVTHGGTAKALIGAMLGLAPRDWRSIRSPAHGRWAVLEEVSFGWRLDEHNVRPRRRTRPHT